MSAADNACAAGPTPDNIRVLAWVRHVNGQVGLIVAATAGEPMCKVTVGMTTLWRHLKDLTYCDPPEAAQAESVAEVSTSPEDRQRWEEPELESPNFTPRDIAELEARGWRRINAPSRATHTPSAASFIQYREDSLEVAWVRRLHWLRDTCGVDIVRLLAPATDSSGSASVGTASDDNRVRAAYDAWDKTPSLGIGTAEMHDLRCRMSALLSEVRRETVEECAKACETWADEERVEVDGTALVRNPIEQSSGHTLATILRRTSLKGGHDGR